MAWLLAALLVMPVAVRAIHLWEEEHGTAESAHPHHDCGSCPICQFTLSTFTETEFVVCDLEYIPAPMEPVASFYDRPCSPIPVSYGLRAPPIHS